MQSGWDIQKDGLFSAPSIKIYMSEDAHATIVKTLYMLGFGKEYG